MKQFIRKDIMPLIIGLGALVVIVAFGWISWQLSELPTSRSPEQHEQAVVVEKRLHQTRSADGGPGSTFYLVTFKFFDDSIKELRVGTGKDTRKVYDSFNESETGILTYKERENAKSYEDRQFVSFEKDSEYGGATIEYIPEDIAKAMIFVLGIPFSILFIIGVLAFAIYKVKPRALAP